MSAPPKPSKPGLVRVFKALYAYEATQPDELSFQEGDVLYVQAAEINDEAGWWRGTCGGISGLIPSNYVSASSTGVGANELQFPLHEAAKRGQLEFMRECIMQRVPLNGIDKSGSSALYWAAYGGHEDCVREILKHGNKVQIDIQNKLGETALHAACWKGQAIVARLLISAGASQAIKNKESKLPRELARNPEVKSLFAKRSEDQDLDYLEDEDEEEIN